MGRNEKVKFSNPQSTNGDSPKDRHLQTLFFQESKKLEANRVFPSDNKSAYKSSFYRPAFDFPFNPDPLASGNNYDIYDEMRVDDQIKAALSFKKDLVFSSGWEIVCENPEIKEFLEFNLAEKLNTPFENSLRDMLSSFEYGFSLTEATYRKPTNGLIELKDLKTRPPHSFEFDLDVKGNLERIRQNAVEGSLFFKPDYFLHHIYQPDFDSPFGRSDLQAAYTAWKTKKFFFRFWAIYVERFAAPTVVGSYPDSFSPGKVGQLQDILKSIQNSTSIAIPEGAAIDFKQSSRDSSDIYEKGISMLNTMIARAVLMPDLMGMSGSQTKGGSFALGSTQFQMFMNLIQKEQDSLSRLLTIKVVRPLTLANWGDIRCEFKFKPFTEENQVEFAKIWVDAVKGNVFKANDEEVNHLRDILNFPKGDVQEAPKPAPGMPFQSPIDPVPPKGEKVPAQEEPEDDDSDNEDARSIGDDSSEKLFREKNEFEAKVNFADITKKLDMAEQRVTPRLRSSGRKILEDFIQQIQKKKIIQNFKPAAINELKPRFQKPMNMEFKRYFKDLYRDSYNRAKDEIFPDKPDLKFISETELLPTEFLEVIDAESFKMVGDYSVNITGKMKNAVTQGIKEGVGERQLLTGLRELGKNESDKWLKTVVRTKSTEMFNRARKSFWDNDPDAAAVIEAFEFSAIIDDRTSEVCQFLDGKVFEKGELTAQIIPPLHFNCRSILVPVTKFEDFKDKKSFVPPSKEPTTEKLKKLGGNLILASDNKTKEFVREGQNVFSAGVIMAFGDNLVIPSPGINRSIAIMSYEISNIANTPDLDTTTGVHSTLEDEVLFQKKLSAGESDFKQWEEEAPWIQKKNSAFLINLLTDNVPVNYTIEYIILDENNNRIA